MNSLQTADFVLLNLHCESYIGEVHSISESFIVLENILDSKTGTFTQGRQRYPRSKITDVNVLPNKEEFLQFEYIANDYVYIYQADEKYHEMIDTLKNKTAFAMYSDDVKFGRNSALVLLTFATEDKVFIVDFINFQKIFKDLKQILENPEILKITHDSGRMCDYLKYKENIDVQGIFDTLITEMTLQEKHEFISLDQCILKYTSIPMIETEYIKWFLRPLNNNFKYIIARKTIYLRNLFNHQLIRIVENQPSGSSSSSSFDNSSESLANSSSCEMNFQNLIGETAIVTLENEMLQGECLQDTVQYLTLINVKSIETDARYNKLNIVKKEILSIDIYDNNAKRDEEKIVEQKAKKRHIILRQNLKRHLTAKSPERVSKYLENLKLKYYLTIYFDESTFSIITETIIYKFDIKMWDRVYETLKDTESVKLVYKPPADLKLDVLDLAELGPIYCTLENFIEENVIIPKDVNFVEYLMDNTLVFFEYYGMYILKIMYSDIFKKSEKYSTFYSNNFDWANVAILLSRKTTIDV